MNMILQKIFLAKENFIEIKKASFLFYMEAFCDTD